MPSLSPNVVPAPSETSSHTKRLERKHPEGYQLATSDQHVYVVLGESAVRSQTPRFSREREFNIFVACIHVFRGANSPSLYRIHS